jgi:integrase
MRRGELLGLKWSDVDLESGCVSVRRQLLREGGRLRFGPPKTRSGRRSICLDAGTVAALVAHRQQQASGHHLIGGTLDLVFRRADGSPHDPDVISHQFQRFMSRSELRRIRLHDLRHTHATVSLQAEVHPKVVQERLGHASVKLTLDTYAHVLPPMHRAAADRFAAMVDG